MAGYSRQSVADIIANAVIKAAPVNAEYNALRDAFAFSGGHKHDGSSTEGAYVPLIADVDAKNKVVVDTANNRISFYSEVGGAAVEQIRIQDGAIVPVTDDDVDLGASGAEFKNLYIDGVGYIDTLTVHENATIAGTLGVTGLSTLASVDINSGSIDNTNIGASTPTTVVGTTISATTQFVGDVTGDVLGDVTGDLTGNVTGNVTGNITSTGTSTFSTIDVNGGAIDGTPIGANSAAAGTFTTVNTSGLATLASVDINGGAIDSTTIGATTPSSIVGTTVTANNGFTGDLTGDLTGNVTGNVTGNLTGDVTGDLTGDVTSTGTSTFADVTINGTLNMNAGTTATIQNLTDPVNAQDAATKNYVDTGLANLVDSAPGALDTLNELAAALGDDADFSNTVTTSIATKLPLAGGTMSGAIAMGTSKITGMGDPTADQDAATKVYVDTQRDTRLATAGGTMTGAIDMGANKVTTTYTPTDNADLTTKTYVDGILGSATAAADSATAAAASETAAASSESAAAASESAAATSASNASTSETNAAGSATAAANSASNASTSEANAATSATNAATSATAASNSESAAATSATSAATSATNAGNSESAAGVSETNAAASASAASTSETNAATSEANAAASFDSFDDRYLGAKASAPTLDNDGDALLTGAIYFNSSDSNLYIWTGSAWSLAVFDTNDALFGASNLSDVASATASRTNLGVGTGDSPTFASTTVDYVDLTQGSSPAHSEGRVFYDNTNKALAVYNSESDITLQVGQEEYLRVYNNTGSTITNGTPVYITGNVGGVASVAPASAAAEATAEAVGLATHSIEDSTTGFVTVRGVVGDLDTSGLTAGTRVHIAPTAGGIQDSAPTYPYFPVDLGICLVSDASTGSIYVNVMSHQAENFRVTGDVRVDNDLTVGGDLTVLGTQTIASSNNVSIGSAWNYFNSGDTIGEANTTFTGSGLDDGVLTGHFEGAASATYYVRIDGVGTGTGGVDTFEWSLDDFSTTEATGVDITGSAQELSDGIEIDFNATTGHTSGDKWSGTAAPVNVDTGIASNRNTGSSGVGYTHMGIFFDVSDEKWKIFSEYDPEPEGTINTGDASFTAGTLVADTFEGNVIATTVSASTLSGDGSSVTNVDADTLDGQEGSYYYSPANAPDPTLTLNGDVSGSATFTNLGNATLTVTVADDSHNHIIANVDGLQTALDGKQAAGTYNTVIGTDSDLNTSGSTIIDNIFVTDGVITSMGTRTLTLADLGYTGATNANYITNNNQLTNGAGYVTTDTTYSAGSGLDLSGTTFSIENDLRGEVSLIGIDNLDFYSVEATHRWYLDGAEDMRLDSSGNLYVEGNVIAYSTTVSDERLKTDIVKLEGALDKVDQLNGYTFTYTADGKKSAGVIAQEVEKVLPSAITESTLPLKTGDEETKYKTVQYDQLQGLIIEAIKELKEQVEDLKAKIGE